MFWFDDEIYNPIMMNIRELEGGNVEEPVKLIRQRHHEAVDIIRKWKNICYLFIEIDLNAGADWLGGTTQYTINNQIVNTTLIKIVDNPINV